MPIVLQGHCQYSCMHVHADPSSRWLLAPTCSVVCFYIIMFAWTGDSFPIPIAIDLLSLHAYLYIHVLNAIFHCLSLSWVVNFFTLFRVQCVISFGLILMIEVGGASLLEVLATPLDKIFLKTSITIITWLSSAEPISSSWRYLCALHVHYL